jgi:hypothetical protein
MVNVSAQPWYWAFLFFLALFAITDHVMQYVRLLRVWPWLRNA